MDAGTFFGGLIIAAALINIAMMFKAAAENKDVVTSSVGNAVPAAA